MASKFEKEFNLLENWRKASARLHVVFRNSHDGWHVESKGSLCAVSRTEESLLLRFNFEKLGFVNFGIQLDRCSFSSFDPRLIPDGVSFPSREREEAASYVSEHFLTIAVSEKTFLLIEDIVDAASFPIA